MHAVCKTALIGQHGLPWQANASVRLVAGIVLRQLGMWAGAQVGAAVELPAWALACEQVGQGRAGLGPMS